MKNKTQIMFLAMAALLLPSGALEAMEIRQDTYEFRYEITRKTNCITFVIKDSSEMNTSSIQKNNLSKIFFDIGSAILSSQAKRTLLGNLQSHSITQDTPLVIRGYSCELGSKHFNLILSMQRAVAVANFLEGSGFAVSALQANGEADPITTEPEELFKNRRVEIRTQ